MRAVSWLRCWSMSATATLAPRWANATAVIRPMRAKQLDVCRCAASAQVRHDLLQRPDLAQVAC
jgi:hypothetical protein